MNSLRQIPLHMLLLAGLVSPMQAEDKKEPVAKAAIASGIAYAGLNVGPRLESAAVPIPSSVGIQVGFIDPKGPSVGKVEEGDILTRLDDQVLFNADQFRALVRTRQPGDKVKLTLLRECEPHVVELTLGARPEEKGRPAARSGREPAETPNGITVVPGGVIPPEVLRQLQEMQSASSRRRPARRVPPPMSSARRRAPVRRLRTRSRSASATARNPPPPRWLRTAKARSRSRRRTARSMPW
jgi:hypothetical protein